MQNNSNVYVGIDVGTSSVRCVLGQLGDDDQKPTIVGVGEVVSEGMRKGTVVDVNEVAQCINDAVAQAEQTSGVRVEGATVNVNGSHVSSMTSQGVIAVSSSDAEITPEEVKRVEEAATIVQLPQNREIIHVFSRNFRLDGHENVKDPIGMRGVRLEVDTHVITASSPSLRNIYSAFEHGGVGVNDRLISAVAGSNTVLSKAQRESGVVLIDIGSSTTNLAIHEEGDIQHVAVIPVGGNSITNDLAIGLKTEIEVAEKLKLKLGSRSDDGKSKKIKIKLGKKEYSFDRSEVVDIVSARVEELFELIDHELAAVGRSGKLPGGAVFVGGGSYLHGLIDYAKDKLSLPARVSSPSGYMGITDKISRPEFACAVGLMLHDMQISSFNKSIPKSNVKLGDSFRRISSSAAGASGAARRFLGKFKP